MATVVAARCQQPILVIAEKTSHFGRRSLTEFQNGIDASFGVRSSIDVVTKKHDDVGGRDHIAELGQQIDERGKIPLDVANR